MSEIRHNGRPIKARNRDALSRDVAHLARLKSALLLDDDISAGESDEASLLIDKLTIMLVRFQREMK